MTTNLRISLAILTLGFGIEGIGELYSFVSHGAFRPGVSLLFVAPVATTLAGLLFVWVGQHEWNELHRSRVRQAHAVFAASLLGAVVAGAVVGLLVARPSLGVPPWAEVLFGAAVGSLVLGTFVTYALLVFHLVPRPSQAALLGAIGWALVVSALVGFAMGTHLGTLLGLVSSRSLSIPGFVGPIESIGSYLFVSYFLLLAAYLDAHRTVAGGFPARRASAPAPGGTGPAGPVP